MEYDPLENFRKQIENVDDEIMILIKRRMQFAKKIAKHKLEHNIELFDQQREDEIIKKVNTKAISMNLSESFVRNLFQSIIDESKLEQEKYIDHIKKNKK